MGSNDEQLFGHHSTCVHPQNRQSEMKMAKGTNACLYKYFGYNIIELTKDSQKCLQKNCYRLDEKEQLDRVKIISVCQAHETQNKAVEIVKII
jgi:hypothetical protein